MPLKYLKLFENYNYEKEYDYFDHNNLAHYHDSQKEYWQQQAKYSYDKNDRMAANRMFLYHQNKSIHHAEQATSHYPYILSDDERKGTPADIEAGAVLYSQNNEDDMFGMNFNDV